ncbi:hypothetical protein GCM10022276_28780 [Sphingomonas limnosediminicola]|uniref:Uncharacterized protein n=1 Tax=Sphingomonas limnosediminicola TaxID=940133 RepID=A0ABP7LXC2_9SPHN
MRYDDCYRGTKPVYEVGEVRKTGLLPYNLDDRSSRRRSDRWMAERSLVGRQQPDHECAPQNDREQPAS